MTPPTELDIGNHKPEFGPNRYINNTLSNACHFSLYRISRFRVRSHSAPARNLSYGVYVISSSCIYNTAIAGFQRPSKKR